MKSEKLAQNLIIIALVLITANFLLRIVLELGLYDPWFTLVNLSMDLFAGCTTVFFYMLFSKHFPLQKWLVPTILTLLVLLNNASTHLPFYSQDFGQFDNYSLMAATFLAAAINITAIIWYLALTIRRKKGSHLDLGSKLLIASFVLTLCAIFIIPVCQFLLEVPSLQLLFLPINLLQSIALFTLFWSELKFEPASQLELRGQEEDMNFEFEE